ncbi:uncharacterized protein VP01_7555g2 [Puccinia sorghi]|uniref:HAT C-terminal dimerisation domain-containing protein n=1 Tax=Puccinia sorghi TaxID=27349 RepID=A0A0L6UC34_9BASI|nr:uncharacterized protein VP01_7555g2 [Puccinia sorghi]
MFLIKKIFQVRSQYNAAQLILAADKMISKLKNSNTLRKISISWLKNISQPSKLMIPYNLFQFEARVFDCSPKVNEKASTDIITYWSKHKKVYPLLALMAKSYLGIPETSSPSEHVFSQSKTIIGPHQHILSSSLIKQLVCIKDWFQKSNKILEIL